MILAHMRFAAAFGITITPSSANSQASADCADSRRVAPPSHQLARAQQASLIERRIGMVGIGAARTMGSDRIRSPPTQIVHHLIGRNILPSEVRGFSSRYVEIADAPMADSFRPASMW